MNNYDEACKAAATNQGLDPALSALRAAGIRHELEQTGGFTMVVTVPVQDGTIGITADEDDEFLAVFYPGTAWQDGPEGDEDSWYGMSMPQVIALALTHGVADPIALWVSEHGASYEVPIEIIDLPDIHDLSWHNDVSPTFAFNEGKTGRILWVDHIDPDERENGPDTPRFTVTLNDDDGDYVDDVWYGDDMATAIARFHGDIPKSPAPEALTEKFHSLLEIHMVAPTARVVFDIIADVQGSYRLVMESAGIAPTLVAEIDQTMSDYINNHYDLLGESE